MRPLPLWTEADLNFLIEARLSETLGREYKQTIAIDKPSDRKELCKDVSGFSNSQGGFIVFGLQETDVQGSGSIPSALSPIADGSLKERLEQIIIDGITPRIEFRVYSFPDSKGTGEYVICDIPKSYRGLHMVTYDRENRYYLRRNFQTVPMNPFEVEDAFHTLLKLEELVQSRVSTFRQSLFPNAIGSDNWGAWISVLAIPTFPVRDLLAHTCFLPSHEISGLSVGMRSLNGLPGIDSFRPSFDGLTSFGRHTNGVTIYHHTIFRDGGLRTGYCLPNKSSRLIGALDILEFLHNSVSFIIGVFQKAGYTSHFHFEFSITFNSGYDLRVPPFVTESEWNPERHAPPNFSFDRTLSFSTQEWISSASTILEPLWHHFWQSFGYTRCYYYDGTSGNYDHKLVLERIKWV